MKGYMNAIYKHDPKAVPPRAIDVRMTENMFVLFVHDGTRRGAAPDAAPGMLMNAMIVESIRGGKIHEVEAMPFVTIPYGLGDGWTEGSER